MLVPDAGDRACGFSEWLVVHPKHKMRVMKTPSGGIRLYVEDELLGHHDNLYASEGEATLVGAFGENDEFRVEALVGSFRI